MDISFEPAFGGGVNFTWQGEAYWAPSVERAQKFIQRESRKVRR